MYKLSPESGTDIQFDSSFLTLGVYIFKMIYLIFCAQAKKFRFSLKTKQNTVWVRKMFKW